MRIAGGKIDAGHSGQHLGRAGQSRGVAARGRLGQLRPRRRRESLPIRLPRGRLTAAEPLRAACLAHLDGHLLPGARRRSDDAVASGESGAAERGDIKELHRLRRWLTSWSDADLAVASISRGPGPVPD